MKKIPDMILIWEDFGHSSYHPSPTAWPIDRLIKVGARVSYHARKWYVHVASAFPLAHHYRVVLA
jgi:hypothetical protein